MTSGPASYRDVVARVQMLVEAALPVGSTVGVLTRGDPALLAFEGLTAWHVPRDDAGGYAGYHPADGRAAVAVVDLLAQAGADFLVVPHTASWWLDHYEGLRERLEVWGPPVAEQDEVAAVYRLSAAVAMPGEPALEDRRIADDLSEIAALLLPRGSHVVLVEAPRAPAPSLDGFSVQTVPAEDAKAAVLRRSVHTSAFLIVPCQQYGWWDRATGLLSNLGLHVRLVTRQAHVGAIYAVGPAAERDERG